MAFGDILRLFTESDDQDLLGRLKPFMPRTLESERLNSILDFYIEAQVRLDKNDFRKLVNLYSLFHRKQSPVEVRSNHLLLNWAVVKLRPYPRLVRHLNLFLPDAHRIPDVRVHLGSSGGRSPQLYADQAAKELMEEENAFFARKLKERPDASSHDDEDLGRKTVPIGRNHQVEVPVFCPECLSVNQFVSMWAAGCIRSIPLRLPFFVRAHKAEEQTVILERCPNPALDALLTRLDLRTARLDLRERIPHRLRPLWVVFRKFELTLLIQRDARDMAAKNEIFLLLDFEPDNIITSR